MDRTSGGKIIYLVSVGSGLTSFTLFLDSFEAENGIAAQEQGAVKNLGSKDAEAVEAQGSYQYTAPDGTPISVQYVANENGFQPQGAHLPVAPEVPAAILRALDWIAAHPQKEEAVRPPGQRRF